MNKTAFKIFICFTVTAAVVATILLGINFLGVVMIGSDESNIYEHSPRRLLNDTAASLVKTEHGYALANEGILPADCWCILIDESGGVIWQEHKPEDIPLEYSINDIARMTRWFLNDYPVYVRTEEYGLLVLGYPKEAVAKFNIEYSMRWFETLPKRLLCILALNLFLAAILAYVFGINLYRRLCVLMKGINDLRQEKSVYLKEKGIFKEIFRNINETAAAIERKNLALARRDSARSNWIAGISHDIRTPLSVIMGYSETLYESGELSEENKKKAETITNQSVKIKKLVENLNLISSLEYDMQPSKKQDVRLCPLIRRIVTELINSGLSERFEIALDLRDEKAVVSADESLLERAIFNLLNNSITHNPSGCKISISEDIEINKVCLRISDNGSGVPDTVIAHLDQIPKSAHGLGLPMAYRIIRVHGGEMTAENDCGLTVRIELPQVKKE